MQSFHKMPMTPLPFIKHPITKVDKNDLSASTDVVLVTDFTCETENVKYTIMIIVFSPG